MLQIVALPVIMFMLFGCNKIIEDRDGDPSLADFNLEQVPEDFEEVSAEAQLAEAAAGVSRTLNDLAEMQRAQRPSDFKDLPSIGSKNMVSGLATINWVGPVEPLLQKIAGKTNLKFVSIGHKTATPIIISIDANQVPLYDIIQDISYQVQSHAIVKINSNKQLELRYLHG